MLPNAGNIHVAISYIATPSGATNGAAVAVGAAYMSCVAFFAIGAAAVVAAISVEADDDGDGSNWVALTAADYEESALPPQTPAASTIVKVGIRGGQRGYQTSLRCVVNSASGPVCAGFILGHPRHAPAGKVDAHKVFIT